MSNTLKIVGIAGSLRENSFNRSLLLAAAELAPSDLQIDVVDLNEIPIFNQDLDSDGERTEPVEALKSAIHSADGVLISTPEYSYSMPGMLKNVLDWNARPGQGMGRPMSGKPTGIMGASPGGSGAMRAQEQVKLALLAMLAPIYPHGGIAVARAYEKFDEQSKLSDEGTRTFLAKYLVGFSEWIRTMQ